MRIGVLASGAGTNLQALIDRLHGRQEVEIVAVGSDRPDAAALERARRAQIETRTFPAADFSGRVQRDGAMADWLGSRGCELIVLAGYMQLLSDEFLADFPDRVINIHPSLLPSFPGLKAVEQALAYGVKVFGVTVFFVDGGVDTGPIILQRALELPTASEASEVLGQLHELEHELLPEAVALIAAGRVSFDPANRRRVVIAR
jgi:phosphoribosylglycinamide formyltransferase 1